MGCVVPKEHTRFLSRNETRTGRYTVDHIHILGNVHSTAPDRNRCRSDNYTGHDSVHPPNTDVGTGARG